MSSSRRLAIMMAAGSRAADAVTGRDLAVRLIARLDGFPTMISPVGRVRAAGRNPSAAQAGAFNHNNIENYIVNKFGRGYDPKKAADSRLYRCQHGGIGMKKDRSASVGNKGELKSTKRQNRRDFLLKTGGILAAGAFGAVPLR